MARPCGEQLDKYGECIDLTGKISTPSLLENLFLTPVPDPLSDRGKSDYIGRTCPTPKGRCRVVRLTLQFRLNLIRFLPSIPCNSQDVGLAAYLAILDVTLSMTCRRIHGGFIPFSAACARETGFVRRMRHVEFSCLNRHQSIGSGPDSPCIATSNGWKLHLLDV